LQLVAQLTDAVLLHHPREIQKVDLHCTVWQVPVSSLPSRVTAR